MVLSVSTIGVNAFQCDINQSYAVRGRSAWWLLFFQFRFSDVL
jgi:hypothetical protein